MSLSNKSEASSKEELKVKYQRKTLKNHIESLPDTYIGSIEDEYTEQYIYDKNVDFMREENLIDINVLNRFIKKNFLHNPGLKNITEEIIINAYDNKNRVEQRNKTSKSKKLKPVTYIKININRAEGFISVENDGEGIDIIEHPVEKTDDGKSLWIPQMIFGELLTSGNYDKSEEKITGGKNGYGAKLTNIFSTYFKLETVDRHRKLKYTQVYEKNMDIKNEPIIEKFTKSPYTKITFKPDLNKFGDKAFDLNFECLIQKRAYDLFVCSNGELDIYFNDHKLTMNTLEDYYKMYLPLDTFENDSHLVTKTIEHNDEDKNNEEDKNNDEDKDKNEDNDENNDMTNDYTKYEIIQEKVNPRWTIAACLSPSLSFEQISFVNGINTTRGGRHVDYIINQITSKLTEMILKKKKVTVREHYIKDNLMIFVNSIIVNPSFDSQTKTTLTTKVRDFGSECIVSQDFIEKLFKSGLVERAIQLNQLKDDQVSKKSDGKKTKKVIIEKLEDAYWAGGKYASKTTLILTEGDSAKAMAMSGRNVLPDGHKAIGVFPLRGKLLNVRDKSTSDYNNNKEVHDIKHIMGLQEGVNYTNVDSLRYGRILIMTDQDEDGSHIKGLLMNFIARWPSLLKIDGFLCSLLTPIVKVWKGNKKDNALKFYTLSDYRQWLNRNDGSKYKHKYYKGLGTSTPKEAKEYFKDFKVINYIFDDGTENAIDLAFNGARSDDRKNWLLNYDEDKVNDVTAKEVSFSDFINYELIHFSNSDVHRSLPNLFDGLKISQRKVLYSCFKKKLTNEIRVAQLAGYVSETSAYHHGEASLHGTIINMAQTHTGSNNIQLLVPEGQFGTRINGGKDCAQPRYIHTYLENITTKIFNEKDNAILKYICDDGLQVEPEYYLPIIPLVLINGVDGIGTGWSSKIPSFNPIDIINNIKRLLNDNPIKEMHPWYRGFKGSILKIGKNRWLTRGVFKLAGKNSIQVTELPIGMWTSDYKEYLDTLIINASKNSSSTSQKEDKTTKKKGRNTSNRKNKKRFAREANHQYLKDYINESTDTTVNFTLNFQNDEEMLELLEKATGNYSHITKFEKIFKLSSRISCDRTMNLFNEKNKLVSFKEIESILAYFVEFRLKKYEDRRLHLMNELNKRLDMLAIKVRFIMDIINKKIKIYNKPKAEIIEQIEKLNYPKVLDEVVLSKEQYNNMNSIQKNKCNYEFLIKMPIYNLTKEKVEELQDEKNKCELELEILRNTTAKDMWITDLDEFKIEYDKFLKKYYKNNDMNQADYENVVHKSLRASLVRRTIQEQATTVSFD
jgi:DNA topoisomerase-2